MTLIEVEKIMKRICDETGLRGIKLEYWDGKFKLTIWAHEKVTDILLTDEYLNRPLTDDEVSTLIAWLKTTNFIKDISGETDV